MKVISISKKLFLKVLNDLGYSLDEGVLSSMNTANANINNRDDAKLYLQILLAFFPRYSKL